MNQQPVRTIVDLTDPDRNLILNMDVDAAKKLVASGNATGVRRIQGQFALVTQRDRTVRMARSLGMPLRYFMAKQIDGPMLIAAERIDDIRNALQQRGLSDQFHPSYTRMAPAHHITTIQLLGCPDPSPAYERFFTPQRATLSTDVVAIGRRYVESLRAGVRSILQSLPFDAPIGVCFSGGIDSGAVLLTTYHAMLELGMTPTRLKAFTLAVDGGGADLAQAKRFLDGVNWAYLLEPIEISAAQLDPFETVRLMEDYKPLDVQAGTMMLALCRGVRDRYPDWKYLFDGDGGDENLKDYPIDENPELTIRSVLNNPLLYHEGWGVGSFKHSQVYSGGLSRACTRGAAPMRSLGFTGFSPFMLPSVIEVAEGIPFVDLTEWNEDRLYELKGRIVGEGIRAVLSMDMPVFPKRRFQHGAIDESSFADRFAHTETAYRRELTQAFHV